MCNYTETCSTSLRGRNVHTRCKCIESFVLFLPFHVMTQLKNHCVREYFLTFKLKQNEEEEEENKATTTNE